MKIILIAALTEKGVIARNGKIPWQIKEELRHFKRETVGNVVIMGRKTFEAIGKGLPERINVVLSSRKKEKNKKIYYFDNLEDALNFARQMKKEKTYIIGGESVFNQTIDFADQLILSFIKKEYHGDRFFPIGKIKDFSLESVEEYEQFTVKRFRRR